MIPLHSPALPMGETIGRFTRYPATGYVYRTGTGPGDQSQVAGVWSYREGRFTKEIEPELCREFERRLAGEVGP